MIKKIEHDVKTVILKLLDGWIKEIGQILIKE